MKRIFQSHSRTFISSAYVGAALVFVVLLSRIAVMEDANTPFTFDVASFYFATIDYDIAETRPHLPGYYLYVETLGQIRKLTQTANTSQVWLSVLYSSIASLLCYVLFSRYSSKKYALLAAIAFATNPLVWYFGSTSHIYSFDLLFSLMTVLLGLTPGGVYLLPPLFALACGYRQSSPVLLLPLFIYFWYREYHARGIRYGMAVLVHAIALGLFAAWFVPMINSTGGLQNYLALYRTGNPIPGKSLLRIALFIFFDFVYLIPLLLIVLWGILRERFSLLRRQQYRDTLVTILLWFVPGLLFYLIVEYSKGYILLQLPALYLLLVLVCRRLRMYVAVAILTCLQIVFYVGFPALKLPDRAGIETAGVLEKTRYAVARMGSANAYTRPQMKAGKADLKELRSLIAHAKAIDKAAIRQCQIVVERSVAIPVRCLQALDTTLTYYAASPDGYIKYWGIGIREFHLDPSQLVDIWFLMRQTDHLSISGKTMTVEKIAGDFVLCRCTSREVRREENKETHLALLENQIAAQKKRSAQLEKQFIKLEEIVKTLAAE